MSFEEVRLTVEESLGKKLEVAFATFETVPIAAASIAQVHGAILHTGEKVVVKVQRPGIVKLIKNDLGVLYTMASLFERYITESRPYNPQAMVDEFFKTLNLETNFIIEANNIRRIAKNFSGDSTIVIPVVYDDYCSDKVLTMERLEGVPLSQFNGQFHEDINRKILVERGLRAFFLMVFKHGLFHGDLHAGNLFILPDHKIGLVDFGVVGRLSNKSRDSIANMLIAMAGEDYESLTYEYLELAPYNGGVNVDQFTKEIRDLFGPYYGMTFKNVNLGKLLLDSTSIAARHSIIMPSELMLFFKSIVTVEAMGRTILEDFDILNYMMDFAQEIFAAKFDTQLLVKDAHQFGRDSLSFVRTLPRQLKQLMRKLNSRDFAFDLHVQELNDVKLSIENSGFVIARGMLASALIIAGTLDLSFNKGPQFYGLPVITLSCYFLAFWIGLFLFQTKR